jgi:hypothetical protein
MPFILLAPLAAAFVLAACGGGSSSNPAGPSAVAGVTLVGTVVDAGASPSSVRALSSLPAGTLTVAVQENPAITAAVGADGSFTLRGLQTGGFTLVFSLNGSVIATLAFGDVRPNQEITITVALSGSSLTLTEERRNGIGHGDLEIEGLVEQVLALDPAGESRYLIAGYTVVARPGETAIREGNRARSVSDVSVGRRVHVKGVWLAPEAKGQPVLAWEIKLQGPAGDPGPTPTPTPPTTQACPTGPNAQVEGLIQSKSAASIVVRQQGKGDFQCDVASGTRIRKGNTTYTFAQLQTGWRVHVSGQGLGASGSLCRVAADEIKVQ